MICNDLSSNSEQVNELCEFDDPMDADTLETDPDMPDSFSKNDSSTHKVSHYDKTLESRDLLQAFIFVIVRSVECGKENRDLIRISDNVVYACW